MKQRVLIFLSLFTLTIFVSSCEKDVYGCMDPLSENYNPEANISDNSCVYARDEFIGSYNSNENCSSGNWTYNLNITAASSLDQVILNNFGDFGENVRATVSGNNLSFNDTQGGITFSGTGSINGTTLTIIYTASFGTDTDNCTMTAIKQ